MLAVVASYNSSSNALLILSNSSIDYFQGYMAESGSRYVYFYGLILGYNYTLTVTASGSVTIGGSSGDTKTFNYTTNGTGQTNVVMGA